MQALLNNSKFSETGPYQPARPAPKDPLLGPLQMALGLVGDSAGVSNQAPPKELAGLLEGALFGRTEPLDDKKGTTELLIGILASLPSKSGARTWLTNKLIDELWSTLQHPPLSYVGGSNSYEVVKEKASFTSWDPSSDNMITFKAPDSNVLLREKVPNAPRGMRQYRMPDGSFNNILQPNLGRAGTPYAKTVKTKKSLHGVKPDAGLLFDLLMERDDKFKENPAGISSMFSYHAAIIIHDLFRTSRLDMDTSETSSYLDLAPLYGSSLKDQYEIRTMKGGMLKPDTFHEKRLLGLPAGVSAMLVLYSRFHNYVCDILLKINENGRFTMASDPNDTEEDKARAVAKQDHDLFNTARLIVGGLYVNIAVGDYLRAITNTHHTSSDWTLDPRAEFDKHYDGEGVPRGVGSQCSVEFNLLYRFHSLISRKDERWTNNFFSELLPNRRPDDLGDITIQELGIALQEFERRIPADPSKRTFDNLKRTGSGAFRDEDIARILKEAMDDPAGSFGSRTIPKALKVVEVLGISQARSWQVASLNEFREFFGLKRHESFSDFNSDPEISSLLQKLYNDPDMVELYPGLLIEDTKPMRSAGSGICPPYSLGRAVLSDAITLVRSDRFNTLDFNSANLTAWGYNEIQPDKKTLGGSMLYKLIHRGLPGWFPFNSLAVMQPMYTKKANGEIAKRLGTLDQYTFDDPKPPPKPAVIKTNASITGVLDRPQAFVVPWLKPLNSLFPGTKDFSWFMLAGDEQRNKEHRASIMAAIARIPYFHNAVHEFVERVGNDLVNKATLTLKRNLNQIDLIRDVAIPLNAQLLADMFYFDLRTDENPHGKLSTEELYGHLLSIRTWGVNNNDPAQAWNRRRRAQEGAKAMMDTTRALVDEVVASRSGKAGVTSKTHECPNRTAHIRKNSLRSCGLKLVENLLADGNSAETVVDNLWLTAFGGIGVPVTAFYEVMEYFLKPSSRSIWSEVQATAQRGDEVKLHDYVLEAQRLVTTQRNVRVARRSIKLEGQTIQPGDPIVMLLGEAGRNPSDVPNAKAFDASRSPVDVTAFSYGQHECIAKDLALAFMAGLVNLTANLKALRPAPGQMGKVKKVRIGTELAYLDESWSDLGFDVGTWKLHFEGHGKGTYEAEKSPFHEFDMQQYYFMLRKRQGLGPQVAV